jgi:sortase A
MSKFKIACAAVAAITVLGIGISPAAGAPIRTESHAISALKPMDWIGKLYVPRYGKNYVRIIEEGTTPSVLNGAGLGHYTGTQLPGEQGNFAIAGHRAANGGPMLNIDKLRSGDRAYVKSKTGWYTYEWVATKVVKPTDVSVVYPVPAEMPGSEDGGSYLTFTSCTPVHVNTFRIVAWFKLVGEQSLTDGPPAVLHISS